MPDVQVEHGYTRIANELLAALNLAPWDSPAQQKVLGALIRVTYGMRRTDAPVGMAAWRSMTGLSDASLKRSLDALQNNGVVVVVHKEDAKRCLPRVWRLQKDYTCWKRFRVPSSDVAEAESVAAHRPPPTPGTEMTPGSPTAPGATVNPGTPTTPAPGTTVNPGPGTEMTPGHASEPYSPNGSRHPKESERKERKKNLTPHPPSECGPLTPTNGPGVAIQNPTLDHLATWLGSLADAVSRLPMFQPGTLRDSLYTLFGPPEMRANAWRRDDGSSVPADQRPRLFATAAIGYGGEPGKRYMAREFALVLRGVIADEQTMPRGPDTALTPAQYARYREIRGELEDGGMDPEEAATEADQRARRE